MNAERERNDFDPNKDSDWTFSKVILKRKEGKEIRNCLKPNIKTTCFESDGGAELYFYASDDSICQAIASAKL